MYVIIYDIYVIYYIYINVLIFILAWTPNHFKYIHRILWNLFNKQESDQNETTL